LGNGENVVAKIGSADGSGSLVLEGAMLEYLGQESSLSVPEVYLKSKRLLLMEHVPGDSQIDAQEEEHAAEMLADLHNILGPDHGRLGYSFELDTVIVGLKQPNSLTRS
jgi:aminoglycoside phosphotransferase